MMLLSLEPTAALWAFDIVKLQCDLAGCLRQALDMLACHSSKAFRFVHSQSQKSPRLITRTVSQYAH